MTGQWIRRVGLVLFKGENGIDLSDFHFKFKVNAADVESPNTCTIRVYNLSKDTVKRIRGEFSEIVLNAGYVGGNYGVIFQGTIKQFRIGRETPTDTYLDIYAADGDIPYNQGVVNTTLAKGSTHAQAITATAQAMGTTADTTLLSDAQHTPMPRGQVLFGMARARLRNIATKLDASWTIENGQVVITPLTGYRTDPIIVVNVATGQIGTPEQTDEGIRFKCLLNSSMRLGGRVKLNNEEIVQLMQADPNSPSVPFDRWAGVQYNAPLSPDGVYRMFLIEHEGDTRGTPWYSSVTCLAIDPSAKSGSQVQNQ